MTKQKIDPRLSGPEPRFRTAYGPHLRVKFESRGPSMTKQAMQDECDINNIMHKYEATGLLDHVNRHHGDYGEFIGYEDYHSSLNAILAADAAFVSLPAQVRSRFGNSAAAFLEFTQDPNNQDAMIEMGLATRRPPPAADEPQEGPPAPKAAPPSTEPDKAPTPSKEG